MCRHDVLTICAYGYRGSGKDYTGEVIESLLKALRVACQRIDFGHELRLERKSGTNLGRKISKDLDAGRLIHEKSARYIMSRAFDRVMGHNPRVLIVSGFPRRVEQADYFYERISVGRRLGFMVERPEHVCVKNAMSRNRPDDKEELIRASFTRFEEFERPAMHRMMELGMKLVSVTPGEGELRFHIPNIMVKLKVTEHLGIKPKVIEEHPIITAKAA